MRRLSALLIVLGGVGCSSASGSDATSADEVRQGAPVAAPAAAPVTREVAAVSDGKHQYLGALWGVTAVNTPDELSIRVYEMGGGDPAINGDYVWIGLSGGAETQGIWNTGLNVRTVSKVEVPSAGTVKLELAWDSIDPQTGDTKAEKGSATIRYSLVNGRLAPTLQVDAPAGQGGPQAVSEDRSAEATTLARVYRMTKIERPDGLIARALELGGGDPAMNGDHVFLSLMAFPDERTFDLGLDVATVKGLRFSGASELTLEGTADKMGDDGIPKAAPFSTTIAFTGDPTSPDAKLRVTTK